MNHFDGVLFSGEFSDDDELFYLRRVKNLQTQSILSNRQLEQLHHYLSRQNNRQESCTITVNDQIPILLNQQEAKQLLSELDEIIAHL
ncbi:hypothetical protein ERJ70_13695 [Sediminibacillus dalangtanensis]|uniref:Uncharacterized protein n=1 Tax=Sediminibacillus dalangtanensis TaxID=2729421 RepID=A0ABX7VXK8_9BACI|nr:hypothetical protein [Sediminibacillus dalangtanensis]QTN00259.1 hypothetical protein ERJ70_13695 [Sediminibacillus dalangtanensis]